MFDYLIHSSTGIDDPTLIGGADSLAEARIIARAEIERDPQRFVTIIDRWDCTHNVSPGRPPKDDADKAVRINITLSPTAIAALDALGGTRSGTIEALIMEAQRRGMA